MSKKEYSIDILPEDDPISKIENDPITKIEISPNGKYLVAYSEKRGTIVGWNVEDIKEGKDIEQEGRKFEDKELNYDMMCVSDEKILAYIDYGNISKYDDDFVNSYNIYNCN